jgi:hypothetical protein
MIFREQEQFSRIKGHPGTELNKKDTNYSGSKKNKCSKAVV